jgi:hypothetical protein
MPLLAPNAHFLPDAMTPLPCIVFMRLLSLFLHPDTPLPISAAQYENNGWHGERVFASGSSGWLGSENRCGTGRVNEKQGFVVAKRLANPSVGKKIAKRTSNSQFNAMNNPSSGKSRLEISHIDMRIAKNGPCRSRGKVQMGKINLIVVAAMAGFVAASFPAPVPELWR